jgi:hypothetical protein
MMPIVRPSCTGRPSEEGVSHSEAHLSAAAVCGSASALCTPNIAMIVALNRFAIANDIVKEVRSAFGRRPHLVDGAAGTWEWNS